jgi:hypothetical protein
MHSKRPVFCACNAGFEIKMSPFQKEEEQQMAGANRPFIPGYI